MRLRVGLWSADYRQTTGQAIVTARVVQHQPEIQWLKYVYSGTGLNSVTSWLVGVCRLWLDVLFGQMKTLYVVCSRSNGGFLRDVPALLVAMVGTRVVVHVHGSDIVDLMSTRRLSPIARFLYNKCEIIVPSAHLLDPLREVLKSDMYVCENYLVGSDLGVDSRIDCDANKLIILWNSNILAKKGFFELAEAVKKLSLEGLNVRLDCLGEALGDADMSAIECVTRLDSLAKNVWFTYLGKVPPPEVLPLVERADVVCLPSVKECQPLAVIQAMCTGRAIVVSDIPALRATIGTYPALYVPVRSVNGIADALREYHRQKMASPRVFESERRSAAVSARARFLASRFDREIANILTASSHERQNSYAGVCR